MSIDEIKFGIEIEMYNISRRKVADILKSVLGGIERQSGNTFIVKSDGREWSAALDRSIHNKIDEVKPYGTSNVCELITPILTISDIPILKSVLDRISSSGGKSDSEHGCAVHLHIDFDREKTDSLKWLCRTYFTLYKEISDVFGLSETQRRTYSKNITEVFMRNVDPVTTSDGLEACWYKWCNPTFTRQSTSIKYNKSRYRIINLHSLYTGKGIELRQFRLYGELDFELLLSYIYYGLGVIILANECKLEAKSFNDIINNLPYEKEFVMEKLYGSNKTCKDE